MLEEFRRWIHRHFNVVLSFVIGITFGISVLALAYFSTRNDVAAAALRYGVQITRALGHRRGHGLVFLRERGRRLGHLPGLVAGQQGAIDRPGERGRSEPSLHGSNAPDRSKAGKIPAGCRCVAGFPLCRGFRCAFSPPLCRRQPFRATRGGSSERWTALPATPVNWPKRSNRKTRPSARCAPCSGFPRRLVRHNSTGSVVDPPTGRHGVRNRRSVVIR